jgi:hypothetical protein
MDAWMDRYMDGWMDGFIHKPHTPHPQSSEKSKEIMV